MDDLEVLGELIEDELEGYDDDYILGDEYVVGEEEDWWGLEGEMDDDYVLGRRRRRRRRRPRARRRRRRRPRRRRIIRPKSPLLSQIPGVPVSSGKRLVLPFGTFVFTNASAQVNTFTSRPQVPMRPARLIAIETPNAAAVTAGVTIDVNDLQVGTRSQFASAGNVPAGAFAPDATESQLVGDAAEPGIDIILQVSTTAALGAGEQITFQAMLYCEAVS